VPWESAARRAARAARACRAQRHRGADPTACQTPSRSRSLRRLSTPTGSPDTSGVPDVVGVNVTLTADDGSIGQNSNFLEIISSIDHFGVLNASAPGVIRIAQTPDNTLGTPISTAIDPTNAAIDLNIDTVTTCVGSSATTCNDVSLVNDNGSITDGHNAGAGGTTANVIGDTVDLQALNGSIGNPNGGNDLKLDSAKGSGCQSYYTLLYQGANYQNTGDGNRSVTATCDVAAQADGSIFITQTERALNVLLAHAGEHPGTVAAPDNIRLTTTETGADCGTTLGIACNDILVLNGAMTTLVVENSPQFVAQGLVQADNGNLELRSADDVVTDPSSEILAYTEAGDPGTGTSDANMPTHTTGNIDIYGDCHTNGCASNSWTPGEGISSNVATDA